MDNIYFQNKELLDKKILKIKSDGLSNLHLVSDFDGTLTKYSFGDKENFSTFALIRESGRLSKDYSKKALALFKKYHPIELDHSLDPNFKFEKMREWWKSHEQLFVESGMHKNIISDILKKYPNIFREGAIEFFDYLNSNNLPLLIFSAGIGNIIENYLEKENKLTSNIHILSNVFNFNDEGFATGYKKDIIHSMNKSESKIENEEYKNLISNRTNIILLGDRLDDLKMVENQNDHTLISICFLNVDIESKLDFYLSSFDVVITNDGSMDYVNKLLKSLSL